jgi:diacylglycerol kinase (ATP)
VGRQFQQELAVQISRALIIVNPASRRALRAESLVVRALRRLGIECEVACTATTGDAARLATTRAASSDAVFVLGGDGTATEVLGALAGGNTPVGVLGAGTGNLLSAALGIPLDPARAVEALCAGASRRIDLAVLAEGRHFAVAAGIGIDARMLERTSAALKRHAGVLAYVVGGMLATREALAEGPFRAHITVDGTTHDVEATSVLVANVGTVLGGRFALAPAVREDDGLLDVCVYAPGSLPQALRVAWRSWRGRFPSDDLTRFYRAAHVRVTAEPRQRAQADGDLLSGHVIDARVLPGAGLVLVPERP